MNNVILRQEIKKAKIPQWRIAAELGVCEMTLIRWLRFELPKEKATQVRSIIAELKQEA